MMRSHEEELSKERTRMAIAYEHDSEQVGKVNSELDQMKSTIAKKSRRYGRMCGFDGGSIFEDCR